MADSADGFEAFISLLEQAAAPTSGRDRLLSTISPKGRLSHYQDQVAALLDIASNEASRLLDDASQASMYEEGPFPGVRLYHVRGGPSVAEAITGFVRIEAGAEFPCHEHLGGESVLVVQGSMLEPETGHVSRAGDLVRAAPGQAHTAVARSGPDLVYLAVLFEGLRVGDTEILAIDPRL